MKKRLSILNFCLLLPRRNGRVVECTGLENQRTERYRGFESLFLRSKKGQSKGCPFLVFGSCEERAIAP